MSQRYNIDVPNCSIIDANFFLWFCLVLALADIYFVAELKLNLLITSSMATKNWNNDFMAKVLEEAAWKELSNEFAWNEQLLEKYKDKVSWKEISDNRNILWTVSMIEKFKNKVDWDELSGSDNEHLFTAENLGKYKNCWNWSKLSGNSSVELTPALLEQFAEYWDWSEIIDCYNRDDLYSMEFLEKYQDYIPASALQRSRLWDKLVEDEKKQLKIRILS